MNNDALKDLLLYDNIDYWFGMFDADADSSQALSPHPVFTENIRETLTWYLWFFN